MLYLVEARASMEKANAIDAGEGPGPVFAKIAERFHPEAFYGNPTARQVFMIVNLETPVQIAELMYTLTWFAHCEPTFTPIMPPEHFAEAIANAKKIITPKKLRPPRSPNSFSNERKGRGCGKGRCARGLARGCDPCHVPDIVDVPPIN